MDDFIVWDSDKQHLREMRRRVEEFLSTRLHLELQPVCLNACSRGITFLGYRVYPHRVGLARRSRQRFRGKLRLYEDNLRSGVWGEGETARHVEPSVAFVRRADSREFRNRTLEEMGLCPQEARTVSERRGHVGRGKTAKHGRGW